jgi:diguanylate cyclase
MDKRTTTDNLLEEFHWIMDVLQNIDAGLIVLDKSLCVQLWNAFMQNHSALRPEDTLGKSLFELFPELPEEWFRRKVQTVFELHNSAFTTWEQRPYLFHFLNYRPVTGMAPHMYQNCTIIPLKDPRGEVSHICLIVYDVTEEAVNRLQLQHLSSTDNLTGLLNRKTLEEKLALQLKRYQRSQRPASLLMLDIDHFKDVNDTYGHPAGDDVIRATARVLKQGIREIDAAGRYGGEEFVVTLEDTDAQGALIVAERLRKKIEQTVVTHGADIRYTISLGIAELSPGVVDVPTWVEAADKGLYEAKEGGRNRTVIYGPSAD